VPGVVSHHPRNERRLPHRLIVPRTGAVGEPVPGARRLSLRDGRDRLLDGERHPLVSEATWEHAPGFGERAEDRPGVDPRQLKPVAERPHGAVLQVPSEWEVLEAAGALPVRLGGTHNDPHPVSLPPEVRDVERDELRAAERAGEADENQRAIADAGERRRERVHHGAHRFGHRRRCRRTPKFGSDQHPLIG
jgi:hypothetical protein